MYTNLLIKIKNASAVEKDKVISPFTKMDMAIVDILVRGGYVKEAEKKGRTKKYIEVRLEKKIQGLKFISTPSRHIYTSFDKLRPVKNGYGLGVVSTSQGIMTNTEARKKRVGGELLFEIW